MKYDLIYGLRSIPFFTLSRAKNNGREVQPFEIKEMILNPLELKASISRENELTFQFNSN